MSGLILNSVDILSYTLPKSSVGELSEAATIYCCRDDEVVTSKDTSTEEVVGAFYINRCQTNQVNSVDVEVFSGSKIGVSGTSNNGYVFKHCRRIDYGNPYMLRSSKFTCLNLSYWFTVLREFWGSVDDF